MRINFANCPDCFVDSWGIYTPCDYCETVNEFNAEIPNWENRLADFDYAESEDCVPEYAIETDSWGQGMPTNADWEWYSEITYVDPAERGM